MAVGCQLCGPKPSSTGGAGLRACPEYLMGKSQKTKELYIYKRRLPHWRMSGSMYFVTWRLDRDQPELKMHEREIIVSILILAAATAFGRMNILTAS
jgi:hypothetical protein